MAFDFFKAPSTQEEDHAWCDWIEIFCLVNIENRITREDILDRILHHSDFYDSDQKARMSTRSTYKDTWEIRVTDHFSIIDYRASVFADSYPFYIDEDEAICLHQNLNDSQKLYLFLLVAFNRRNFDKSDGTALSTSFELLSLQALKSLLPDHADVFIYGTSATAGDARFTGNPHNKFIQLVDLMRESPHPQIGAEDFPTRGGDSGLDLVGIVPFADFAGGRIIVLGQCAVSQEEWSGKQFSVSDGLWRNRIVFTVPPISMLFMPGCYRRVNGNWFSRLSIASVLIDRLRMMELISHPGAALAALPANHIVTQVLAYREQVA